MDLDDRQNIQTAEGLALDLTLAGLGSRLVAAIVDALLLGLLLLLFFFAAGAISATIDSGAFLVQGLAAAGLTLIVLGYYVGFETLDGGRTPGKRSVGIRVVTTAGEPIGFLAAFVRNLLRVVDFLPIAYGVGAVSVLATRTNQRLGDLTAGTIVIRERMPHVDRAPIEAASEDLPAWDVTRIGDDEVDLLRRFAVRRRSIPEDRVEQLAGRLAAKLRPKVAGEGVDSTGDVDFLMTVLGLKLR